jgi:hypothetical protein
MPLTRTLSFSLVYIYSQYCGHTRPALATTCTSKSWSVFRMRPGINIILKIIGSMTFTIFTITLASSIEDGIHLMHAHAILIGSVAVTPTTGHCSGFLK